MDSTTAPQVFISYSRSSEEHLKSVVAFAERLCADGVDVVLDEWNLKKGHNLHKFMESMVTSKFSKVLLILDKEYRKKADGGVGGVGIETEIVSAEIYNKADQNKFIPVVWEHDEEGKPCLPIFLKARLHVNLSPTHPTDEYPELLRTVFDKPRFIKPSLGKPPAFLQEEAVAAVPSSFHRLRQRISASKTSAKDTTLKSFFDELAERVASLLIPGGSPGPTDDDVLAKIQSFEPILVEFDRIISELVETEPSDLVRHLKNLFEACIGNYTFKESNGGYYQSQFSAVHFVSQELLLHTVTAFLKSERFEVLDEFFKVGLIHRKNHNKELGRVFDLYNGIEILDKVRNQRLGLNRTSVIADLMKERAKGPFTIEDIAQAEFVVYLRAVFEGEWWFPRTLIWVNEYQTFDLFLRSEVGTYFEKFSRALGVTGKEDFLKKWDENKENLRRFSFGWRPLNLASHCNLDKIATR